MGKKQKHQPKKNLNHQNKNNTQNLEEGLGKSVSDQRTMLHTGNHIGFTLTWKENNLDRPCGVH